MKSFWRSPAALSMACGLPLRIAVLVLCATLLPIVARAAQVTFQWDYQDPRATGFNLYCGPTSGIYDIRMDVGNTTSAAVSGFTEGSTYHCAVTAYNAAEESPFSNEITVIPQAAPNPNFSMSTTSGIAPLSVAFTNTTSGQASRWQWDFGDGSGSTLQHPTHIYSTPGSYTVVLTAFGPGGSASKTAPTSIVVTAAPPPPAPNFTMSTTSGIAPLGVVFTNTTSGQASAWQWNFGDGSGSTLQHPTHIYSTPGGYTVVLTAFGPGGSVSKTAATSIVVTAAPNAPPNPSFTMSTTSGMAPLSVAFTNTTSGQASAWQWDFGDGSGSTLQHPTHVYSTPGGYTVVLTAIGPGGSVSKTAATSITVGGSNAIISAVRAAVSAVVETPPTTDFTISSTSGIAPLTVNFTNTTTRASGWLWYFGDGATSSEQSPAHTYNSPGTYTAVLTATGPGGTVSKTSTTPVTVGAAPGMPVGTNCSSGSPPEVLFGDTTIGTDELRPVGVARAFSVTTGGCGKVGSLNVYLGGNSTATGLRLGLYSDAGGHPGLLLAQGSTSNPIAGAWNAVPIFPTRVDTPGVYWIAILGTQGGGIRFHTKAGGCAAETSAQSDLTTLPSAWTTGAREGACQVSAYASSTP